MYYYEKTYILGQAYTTMDFLDTKRGQSQDFVIIPSHMKLVGSRWKNNP